MEPDHKELLIGLIGSTFGDLKKLDDSIISQSSTLGRRSEAVKQELAKVVATSFAPQPVAIPTNPPPQPFVPPPPQVYQIPPVMHTPAVTNEPQMEFDFDKKARYIEVVDALQVVEAKIDNLDDKLDKIIELLSSKETKEVKPRTRKKVQSQIESEIHPEPIQEEQKKKVPGI